MSGCQGHLAIDAAAARRDPERRGCFAVAIAVALVCLLGTCCSPCGRTYYPVSADEFIAIYDAPRMKTLRWDVAEPRGIFAVLDYYSLGGGSWPEYTYSVFVLRSELPASFPNHPQPPMSDFTESDWRSWEERVPTRDKLAARGARGSVSSLP